MNKVTVPVFMFCILVLAGCRDKNVKPIYPTQYSLEGNLIVAKQFDSLGRLKYKDNYIGNTAYKISEYQYYPNGKLKKWSWHLGAKYPFFATYYDTNGKYSGHGGFPILRVSKLNRTSDIAYIQIANPPNIKCEVVFSDSFNKKTQTTIISEIIVTDTCSWAVLKQQLCSMDHGYYVCVYFLDKSDIRIDSSNKTAIGLP